MPQPDHATDSPLRTLALSRRPQLALVQEPCRTRADGMEIFRFGAAAGTKTRCELADWARLNCNPKCNPEVQWLPLR